MDSFWLGIGAVVVAGGAWLRYRANVARNYGVASLSTIALERFPAQQPDYSKCIAITGGCGFVGRRIVQMLLESDPNIRIIVVDTLVPKKRDPRVEHVRASITNAEHVVEALRGADTVIHTASVIPNIYMQKSRLLDLVNVEGTKNVILACRHHGIKRLVYTSSATVVIEKNDMCVRGVDEEAAYAVNHLDRYTETKHAAEILVREAVSSGQLHALILRPAAIFGMGDKLVTDYYAVGGQGHLIIGTGNYFLDWVHVDNVAWAHVLAASALVEKPEVVSGQIYNISSCFSPDDKPKLSHGELVGDGEPGTLDHWGHPRPKKVPVTIILLLALLNEFLWTCFGVTFDPVLSSTTLLYTQRDYYFSSAKAAKDLGYSLIVPVRDGVSKIVAAYKDGTHYTLCPQSRIEYI